MSSLLFAASVNTVTRYFPHFKDCKIISLGTHHKIMAATDFKQSIRENLPKLNQTNEKKTLKMPVYKNIT